MARALVRVEGGVLAAYYFRRVDLPKPYVWEEEEEPEDKPFFQRNTARDTKLDNTPPTIIYHIKPRSPERMMIILFITKANYQFLEFESQS
jgi:hypothetical protein